MSILLALFVLLTLAFFLVPMGVMLRQGRSMSQDPHVVSAHRVKIRKEVARRIARHRQETAPRFPDGNSHSNHS